MNDVTKTKGLLGIFGTVVGYLYNCLTELVVVLTFLIIMDYVLGIVASYMQDRKFDKDKAIKGALKKVMYPFILALAFLGDYTLNYLSVIVHVVIPINGLVGIAAVAYLVGTEGFSCAKNLIEIGIPCPPFLMKFFGVVRDSAENLIKTTGKEELK